MGSYDNNIYALNSDGTLKWKYATGDHLNLNSPAIGNDGTIYIGSWDGKLYAFGDSGSGSDNGIPGFDLMTMLVATTMAFALITFSRRRRK